VSAQTITDTKWVNGLSGGAGLTTNEERGRSLYIFAGTGAGYEYLIESNTSTAITIVGDWRVTPDSTSRYVILDSDLGTTITADVSDNPETDKTVALRLELKNYAGRVIILTGHMVTADGKRSIAALAPRREVYIAGVATSGGGAGTAPTITFTPAVYGYGAISVTGCAISGASTLGKLQGVTVTVFYVDEMTADVWASLGSSVGSGDPLIVGVTLNGSRITTVGKLDFTVGQYLLFNDAGHYEIGKLTAMSGLTWTLARPGYFGGAIADHASGTKLYIIQERTFTFAPSAVDYSASPTTITVSDQMDCQLPNALVVAMSVAATFNGATGTRTIQNTARATVPGLRTLVGYNYRWQLAGTLAVNQLGLQQIVQFESSIRVAFARAGTGPTGAALTIAVEKSTDNGVNWSSILTVTIAAGSTESFSSGAQPGDQREPYSGSWPFEILRPNDRLRAKVTGVGSSTAGANVTLEVYA
jgi:hypothetical protein